MGVDRIEDTLRNTSSHFSIPAMSSKKHLIVGGSYDHECHLKSPTNISPLSSMDFNIDVEVQHLKDPKTNSTNAVSPDSNDLNSQKSFGIIDRKNDEQYATDFGLSPQHVKHSQNDVVHVVTPDKELTVLKTKHQPASIKEDTFLARSDDSKSLDAVVSETKHIRFQAPETNTSLEDIAVPSVEICEKTKPTKLKAQTINKVQPFVHMPERKSMRPRPVVRKRPSFYAPSFDASPHPTEVSSRAAFTSACPAIPYQGPIADAVKKHELYIPPKGRFSTEYASKYIWHTGAYGNSSGRYKPSHSPEEQTMTSKVSPKKPSLASKAPTHLYSDSTAKRLAKLERRKLRRSAQSLGTTNIENVKVIPIMYQTEYMRAFHCPMR